MFAVEAYAAVRDFVFNQGKSRREAARVFGLSRETITKMCRFSLPPGYTRTKPAGEPKLGLLLPVTDAILEADRSAPVKQRHTAKRIFERLRDEHGFAGGYTVVKDYVRIGRARGRETFVPLSHPPGHAQVDSGAFGHRRTREWMLSGITRDLLDHASIWCLMSHCPGTAPRVPAALIRTKREKPVRSFADLLGALYCPCHRLEALRDG